MEIKKKYVMEAKLMDHMTHFGLTDFMGFAKLCKVDEETIKKAFTFAAIGSDEDGDAIGDLVCEIVEKFSELGRKARRELLKLAEEIAEENEKCRQKEGNDSPNQ